MVRLPLPLSPKISTGTSLAASAAAWARSLRMTRLAPTKNMLAAYRFDIVTRDVGVPSAVDIRGKVAPYDPLYFLVIQRPEQAVSGAESNGFLFLGRIIGFANQNDWKLGPKPAQPAQEVQPICVSQWRVQHEQVRSYPRLDSFNRSPSAGRTFNLPGICFCHRDEWAQQSRFLAHDKQPCGCV